MSVKQVIVMRKDLKMRRGKEIAQGSHASMAFLTKRIKEVNSIDALSYGTQTLMEVLFTKEEQDWINGLFTKVCLQVESEAELLNVYNKAKEAGLTVNLITDSGLTEFGGVPTNTCLAIGPHEAEKIDAVTRHLKLY